MSLEVRNAHSSGRGGGQAADVVAMEREWMPAVAESNGRWYRGSRSSWPTRKRIQNLGYDGHDGPLPSFSVPMSAKLSMTGPAGVESTGYDVLSVGTGPMERFHSSTPSENVGIESQATSIHTRLSRDRIFYQQWRKHGGKMTCSLPASRYRWQRPLVDESLLE